jgi:chorismate mutase
MIDRTEEGLAAITAKIDELEALLVKLNEQRREIINYLGTNKC